MSFDRRGLLLGTTFLLCCLSGQGSVGWSQDVATLETNQHGSNVVVSPDGKMAALGQFHWKPQWTRAEVVLWDLKSNKVVREFNAAKDSECHAVAFSPDGKQIAAVNDPDSSGDTTVDVWDVATGKLRWSTKSQSSLSADLFWTEDALFVSKFDKGAIGILNPDNGELLGKLSSQYRGNDGEPVNVWFNCVCYVPSTKQIFCYTHRINQTAGRVWVFDANRRTEIKHFDVPAADDTVDALDVSHDGKYLTYLPRSLRFAGTTQKPTVRVWDVASGQVVWQWPIAKQEAVPALAFVRDTNLLTLSVTSNADQSPGHRFEVIDVASRKSVMSFATPRIMAEALAWTPDRRTLIAASNYNNTQIARLPRALPDASRPTIQPRPARPPQPDGGEDPSPFRTWTSSNGKYKIDGRFVSQDDANVVLQRKDNGKRITVPKDRLSAADRRFLASLKGPRKQKPLVSPLEKHVGKPIPAMRDLPRRMRVNRGATPASRTTLLVTKPGGEPLAAFIELGDGKAVVTSHGRFWLQADLLPNNWAWLEVPPGATLHTNQPYQVETLPKSLPESGKWRVSLFKSFDKIEPQPNDVIHMMAHTALKPNEIKRALDHVKSGGSLVICVPMPIKGKPKPLQGNSICRLAQQLGVTFLEEPLSPWPQQGTLDVISPDEPLPATTAGKSAR